MKHIICCMLLCIGFMPANACNSCGSSTSGQSLGLLPSLRQHFIGAQYQYRSFSSIHPSFSETKPDVQSDEGYTTLQLWGRYNVSSRIQLFAFVPFSSNVQKVNGTETRNNGIGDVSALVNYVVLRKVKEKRTLVLLAGVGIKAPTGRYDGFSAMDRNGLPNMQPGTGTWDFVANTNYTLQYLKWGANAEASYTFTTVAKDQYKYGNRLSAGLSAFYRWQKGAFSILPQVGMRYEYALHDYDNYSRKWLNEQTGGYHVFSSVGIQAYYKKAGIQLGYFHPLTQDFAAGNVSANYFTNAGLFLLL